MTGKEFRALDSAWYKLLFKEDSAEFVVSGQENRK